MFIDIWNRLRYYVSKVTDETEVGDDKMNIKILGLSSQPKAKVKSQPLPQLQTQIKNEAEYDVRINELQRSIYELALREFTMKHNGTKDAPVDMNEALSLLERTANRRKDLKLSTTELNKFTK